MNMDVFDRTYMDAIKTALGWFRHTGQLGKDGMLITIKDKDGSHHYIIKEM
jgi:hypothetical protein